MAIKSDNSLWAWGNNVSGKLGNGKKTIYHEDGWIIEDNDKLSPVKIMDDVIQVSTGMAHTAAIKSDGTLWVWGFGWTSPEKIMDNVIQVSAGGWHFMAIKNDGTLWGFGDNACGGLGDGTTIYRDEPVKVMDNVIFVSAGRHNTMAIKKDGTLWGWGSNNSGQLGDGTTTIRDDNWNITKNNDKTTPIKIMDNVIQVVAGDFHTMAIKKDGTLWGWGTNWCGTLGDGTWNERAKPVQISK
jgi:alpha-tubulin suppressor-like RCC1 family protein